MQSKEKVALDETITEWPWYRESVRVYWVTKFFKCPKSRKNKKMVLFFSFKINYFALFVGFYTNSTHYMPKGIVSNS